MGEIRWRCRLVSILQKANQFDRPWNGNPCPPQRTVYFPIWLQFEASYTHEHHCEPTGFRFVSASFELPRQGTFEVRHVLSWLANCLEKRHPCQSIYRPKRRHLQCWKVLRTQHSPRSWLSQSTLIFPAKLATDSIGARWVRWRSTGS